PRSLGGDRPARGDRGGRQSRPCRPARREPAQRGGPPRASSARDHSDGGGRGATRPAAPGVLWRPHGALPPRRPHAARRRRRHPPARRGLRPAARRPRARRDRRLPPPSPRPDAARLPARALAPRARPPAVRRPLRPLTFLAFYQHPAVLATLEVDWAGRAAALVARRAELLDDRPA